MSVTIAEICAGVLLLIAFISDVRTMRIPNLLTATALASALFYHCIFGGLGGGLQALLGALAGALPLFVLYLLKGIGAGDVKLFAALGAWIGSYLVLQTMMYAILYAGAVGVVLLICRRSFAKRVIVSTVMLLIPQKMRARISHLRDWSASGLRFPFMIAAVPGALTAWLMISAQLT